MLCELHEKNEIIFATDECTIGLPYFLYFTGYPIFQPIFASRKEAARKTK